MRIAICSIAFIFIFCSCENNSPADSPADSPEVSEKAESVTSMVQHQKESVKEARGFFETAYRDHQEIPELKNHQEHSANLIYLDNDRDAFTLKEIQYKQEKIVLLEQVIPGEGKNKFKILDTLKINNLASNSFLLFGACLSSGKLDRKLIALFKLDEKEEQVEDFRNPVKAWTIDAKSKKIVEFENKEEVVCGNPDYGAE